MVQNIKKIAKQTTVTNKIVKSTNVAIMKATPDPDNEGADKGLSFFLPDSNDLTKMNRAGGEHSGNGTESVLTEKPALAVCVMNC